MTASETILWRRIDTPGHDACRLTRRGNAWDLSGTAVFSAQSLPTRLDYRVLCDNRWHTQEGSVTGWSGSRVIEAHFRKNSDGSWTIDGRATDSLADCIDLDFGFTPATNILQLRRLALGIGERAVVPVAWFDIDADDLHRLPQTYERISERTYRYEAPTVGYAADLELNAFGFVRSYPHLWKQVE